MKDHYDHEDNNVNVTEANAMNRVLRFVLARPPVDPELAQHARTAAEFLAERAYATLGTGIRPEQVAARWPGLTAEQRGPAT